MTISRMTFSIMGLFVTLGINETLSITVSSAVMLNVTFFIVLLSVVIVNVDMLSVVVLFQSGEIIKYSVFSPIHLSLKSR
jgi:hypothetical protein